jgi:hypothetical protein
VASERPGMIVSKQVQAADGWVVDASFYKVTFHGTGNAAGSGYFKAVILPRV